MELKPGLRLRSTVCSTEAIIIKAPAGDADLRCGGFPVTLLGKEVAASAQPDSAFQTGTLIGKRYVDENDDLEVLVTKAGKGSLSLGNAPLKEKPAKKLPSSD
jgi:hypothetical protein